GDNAGFAIRRRRPVNRRAFPGKLLVDLLLPAFRRHALVEVALRIHEPYADERDSEIAGFLAMIASQDAKSARINRQRLMEGKFGGKIRDRSGALGVAVLPPGIACAARGIQ